MNNPEFVKWLRNVINPQAVPGGNSVCVDDYAKDGMSEYSYPKEFIVEGDSYRWSVSSCHTKRRHLCTHYELWFYGKAFKGGCQRISTGYLTKAKLRSGLKIIYNYYLTLKEEKQ
jgi:hypothetical protein